MVVPSTCLDCGRLTKNRRCPDCCRQRDQARQPKTAKRGYGSAWQRLSRQVRQVRGQCEWCGSTDDLTVDHLDGQATGPRGLDPTNTRVLCRACHAVRTAKARGARQ